MARMQAEGNRERTAPRWAGTFLHVLALLPGGGRLDPALFFAEDSVVVDVGAAGALAGAVAIPLDAPLTLGKPAGTVLIPSGTLLVFEATGKVARTSADTLEGAVAIPVAALGEALVNADVARYLGRKPEVVSVPSGILVGRTIAERDAHAPFGPAADADDEKFLLAWDVSDVRINPDCELVLPSKQFVVKENYLPAFATLSAANQAFIRASWTCTLGWE